MLMVKTFLSISPLHGIGLFADEEIEAGKIVWRLNDTTSRVYSRDEFEKMKLELSLPAAEELITSSYVRNGLVYYLCDRSKFINHSNTPNLAFQSDEIEVAIRNIYRGEELLENYFMAYDEDDFCLWKIASNYIDEQVRFSSYSDR